MIRSIPDRLRTMSTPVQEFLRTESASGIVLMAATVLALIAANSPLAAAYQRFLDFPIHVNVGTLALEKPLLLWINDGLMAVFFLLVGLEIKREIRFGQLARLRVAILPVAAAFGGAVVPALIFVALNWNTPEVRGWAIPMATDIAFALGVLALVGKGVPNWLKIFLMSLAIVDDLIAVLVIALFYSHGSNVVALALAGAFLALLILLNAAGVHRLTPYMIVGLLLWVAVLKSGVHATIAGVLLGLVIPASRPKHAEEAAALAEESAYALRQLVGERAREYRETGESAIQHMEDLINEVESPLYELEHDLHGLVAFFIIPLFAFANAGVTLQFSGLGASLLSPLSLGIILGLVLGKQAGIFGAAAAMVKGGLSPIEGETRPYPLMYGAALTAGIGFTMSIFVATLAFGPGAELETAKVAILLASLISGVAGYVVLKSAASKRVEVVAE